MLAGQYRAIAELIEAGALAFIKHIHRRQPPARVGGHGHQDPLEPLDQCLDARGVEHIGVEFGAQAELVSRQGLHRERVVVVFAVAELGDGQPLVTLAAQWRGGVDGVVFEHEQGVEQLVVAGETLDLAERQVLVLKGFGVGTL